MPALSVGRIFGGIGSHTQNVIVIRIVIIVILVIIVMPLFGTDVNCLTSGYNGEGKAGNTT